MKYKVYSFLTEKIKDNTEKLQILSNFEFIPSTDESAEQILKHQYHVIDFPIEQYKNFSIFLKTIDWKTNLTSTADCLILKDGIYHPKCLLPEAVINILKKNVNRVNSQKTVFVVGEYEFVLSMVAKLAVTGFTDIIISLLNDTGEDAKKLESKLAGFIFDLKVRFIAIEELTSAQEEALLMISNFNKELNKEAYDLLSYFNFLSEGAMFIDCNSLQNGQLVEDARKADVFAVDELEILDNKYIKLLELLKNPTKV